MADAGRAGGRGGVAGILGGFPDLQGFPEQLRLPRPHARTRTSQRPGAEAWEAPVNMGAAAADGLEDQWGGGGGGPG